MMEKIAIVGYGRSGKDTAGKYLAEISTLRYVGSCSDFVRPLIAKELNVSEEQVWADRHKNRQFWKDWCDAYKQDDPAKLIRACLSKGDMVIGIRGKEELSAGKFQGLINLTIWIENPNVPIDYTVEFSKSDCDIIILNESTYENFYEKLRRLANYLGVLKEV